MNDAYNIPDEQGRVVINIGHPEAEEDIFLAPQIARIIKPHQIGGVRFLFDNIIESVERFSTSTGFGCILAHSMGLGKTLQLVCFIDIFLRHTNSKTILCIMPINTLQNWLAEFNMWLPEEADKSPLSAQGEVRPRNFKLFVLNDTHKTLNARSKIVLEWAKTGGVLLIGYELYRLLSLKKVTKRRGRKTRDPEVEEREAEEHKKLLDEMHAALVKPGPDLVVCDEGHRIKNSHASISVALKQIRSKRRIVLTGYPLQNNLIEYWCMVDFVRPNYLGTKTEFSNMFERPIQNGQCIDSTPQDIKLMRYRAHVLHSLLLGFVQRRSHVVLQNSLPQKEEFVILVRMTPFQRKLYDVFMNDVVRTKAVPNPLKAFAVCCKIWNHPDVLYNFLKKREADLDLEEAEGVATETSFEVAGESSTPAKAAKKKTPSKKAKKGAKGNASPNSDTDSKANDTKPAASVPPNTAAKSSAESEAQVAKTELTDNTETDKHESIKSEQKNFSSNVESSYSQAPPQQTPTFTQSNQSNAPQYNQMPYNSTQEAGGAYHANYPYPAFQAGFNSSYNNYKYDSNYYNNYPQPNAQNSQMSNRYYWNQSQHQSQSRPANAHPQSNYDFSAMNESKNHQNDYGQGPWPGHNNPQYYPQHEYQSGGSFTNYGSDYHSMYNNMQQSNANQTQQNPPFNAPSQALPSFANSNQPQQTNSQWNHNTTSSSVNQNTQQTNNNQDNSPMNFHAKNVAQSNQAMNCGNSATNNVMQNQLDVKPANGNYLEASNSTENTNSSSAVAIKSESLKSEPNEKRDEKADASSSEKGNDDESADKKSIDLKEEVTERDAKVKDDGIPYDWAIELMKNYTPDLIENSTKMEIFFHILKESVRLGDRMLIFSQSLLTLNLIERFLQANPTAAGDAEVKWAKNTNYYRKYSINVDFE